MNILTHSIDIDNNWIYMKRSNGIKYTGLVEKDKIYKFLLEHNKDLDEVYGRILGTKPLSKVRERVGEKSWGNFISASSIVSSTLAAWGKQARPAHEKNCLWHDHCKKLGHTKDTYWDIYGKHLKAKPF
ncbi:hypothetical protein CR513_22331, partial [Mucuna pruriens]